MKKIFFIFFIFLSLTGVYAQDIISGINDLIPTISENVKALGLIPNLSGACEDQEKCNLFEHPETQAFLIVLITMWMAFNIVLELSALPSTLGAFFLSSLLFNHLPSLFGLDVVPLFKYVFSGLFIFIWLEYILKYLWAFSKTTKLLIQTSVTMIALFFMKITSIFDLISNWIEYMLTGVGLVIFILFMVIMRIVNGYLAMLHTKGTGQFAGTGGRDVNKQIGIVQDDITERKGGFR